MKSSQEIIFDYQNAMTQAKRLDELAESIERQVAGRMDDSVQSIHAAWKGDTSVRYLNKAQTLKDKIKKTSHTLRDMAGDIRRIATALYNAEMEAIRIAKR